MTKEYSLTAPVTFGPFDEPTIFDSVWVGELGRVIKLDEPFVMNVGDTLHIEYLNMRLTIT